MAPSVSGSASAAAERTAAKLEAIRSKMPNSNKTERVEQKYDVVLEYPNLELHSAAASGNVGLVQYALTHGQPVNSLLHGCLPLHAASSGGNVSVVRMLIESGADVNAPRLPRRYSDNKRSNNMPAVGTAGSTPLHFAAANGHAAVVQLLLACGAVPDKPDKNGMSPEDLAEMSGHGSVVHTMRVWRQMSETQALHSPTTTGSDVDREGVAASRRPRRDSVTSSGWTESDGGELALPTISPNASPNGSVNTSPTAVSKRERAQTAVAAASEKGRNLLRSKIENGLRAPIKNVLSKSHNSHPMPQPLLPPPSQPQSPPEQSARNTPIATPDPPSTPQSQPRDLVPTTPKLTITTSTPPQREPGSAGLDSSPFHDSPISGEVDDEPAHAGMPRRTSSNSVDSSPPDLEPGGYRQMSSRRPSLPSIIEKSAHPGAAFRAAIQKTDESSPSITETPAASPPSGNANDSGNANGKANGSGNYPSFLRGRSRNMDRRINKQAILGLFRRGNSPHSRSPSPPRKTEPTPPLDVNTVDANVARLKRASMDPELMRMALDVAELSEQLEANATVSAPVTKTRFFEDVPRNSSSASLSSGSMPGFDRPWERRKGSGVISPSPLAREWSGNDDEPLLAQATIRRTRTEVRRVTPTSSRPRRMPSEPHMAAAAAARRRSMAGNGMRAVSDPAASPSTTPSESPLPVPSDAEAADDEREDVVNGAIPSIQALADQQSTPEDTEEEGNPPSSSRVPSAADVPSLTRDAPESSDLSWSTELRESENANVDRRRFRGESVGSSATASSRGLRTPPTSQMIPPGSSKAEDSTSPAPNGTCPNPTSPRERPRGTRSRGHSEASMTLGPGFPPVPEHETAEVEPRPSVPTRRISTHAEARNAMQKTEQDVLALAQMPATEDSCRSLADQLAAYGDTHAIAEEFARVERLSSLSSGSERNSVASSDSAGLRKRPASFSTNRNSRLSTTSPTYQSVPSISEIYERRDKAHRDRMQTLTSSTPIYTMRSTVQRSRSVSSEYASRNRASTTSDNWLNAGPNAALRHAPPQRRMTAPPSEDHGRSEPSAIVDDADSNPHISGPLPMVTEPQRLGQKPRSRSSLSVRPQLPTSLKQYTPSIASMSHMPPPRVGGLARSTSLHRPNDKVNSMRYQGLAQARHYAAATAQATMTGRESHLPGDGHDSDDSDERSREYTMIANDWRGGYVIDGGAGPEKPSRKWGLKSKLGNLRK